MNRALIMYSVHRDYYYYYYYYYYYCYYYYYWRGDYGS